MIIRDFRIVNAESAFPVTGSALPRPHRGPGRGGAQVYCLRTRNGRFLLASPPLRIDPPPTDGTRPTAWVLAAPGAGDNRQLESMVRLLGAEARWFRDVEPVGRVLADRLPGGAAGAGTLARRGFEPPWPDLVLIAGGRSVVEARRIREASGGAARIVCIGRPWASLVDLDLVVTTPQYRLPERENVIVLDLPLNLPDESPDVDDVPEELASLPRPRIGVLLGGPSGSYRFPAEAARELGRRIDATAQREGASVLVTGSPRTPDAAFGALTGALTVPHFCHRWQPPPAPNPFRAMLRGADALLVTADSASMLADAVHSGTPTAVLPLPERLFTRLARRTWVPVPGLGALKRRLVERGLWVPARDLRTLHERAREDGLVARRDRVLDFDPGPGLERHAERIAALRDRVLTLAGS